MLLEPVDEHSRQQRALVLHRVGGAGVGMAHVEGVQVGQNGRRLGMVREPVRVRLEHALHGCVVAGFRQKFQTDSCLTLPFGSGGTKINQSELTSCVVAIKTEIPVGTNLGRTMYIKGNSPVRGQKQISLCSR